MLFVVFYVIIILRDEERKYVTIKHKVAILIVFIIATSTGYFLWQIDRHEKALLGREWLIAVPVDLWNGYIQKEQEYNRLLDTYIVNNQDIIVQVKRYQLKGTTPLTSDRAIMEGPMPAIISVPQFFDMIKRQPEVHKKWSAILADTKARKPVAPQPSNPPKAVIQQSIQSLYRYMIAIDSVLLLSLLLFLILYKESYELDLKNKNT